LGVLVAIVVIAAMVALVVWTAPFATSGGVGAEDAIPKAGAGSAIVHDDAGNMPLSAGSAVIHDDAGSMLSDLPEAGAVSAAIHDDAGNVHPNAGSAVLHDDAGNLHAN
jgi:hypothetical protein